MSYDISGGLKNLLPGALDSLRGPYASVAAANTAIPNTLVGGVSYRQGKFVDIGTAGNYVTYWWGGGYADTNLVPYFTGLAKNVDVVDAQNVTSQYFDKSTVITSVGSFNKSLYTSTGFQDTTNTFGGHASSIGKPTPGFYGAKIRVKTKTSGSTPTSVRVQVRETSKTGAILADKTVTGLTMSLNTDTTITVDFGVNVLNPNNANLYFMYAFDQQVNRYGTLQNDTPYPYSTYAISSHSSGVLQDMAFVDYTISGTDNRANYIELLYSTDYIDPNEELFDKIETGIPSIADIPPVKAIANATSYFRNIFTAVGNDIFPRASGALQDATSTFSGWKFPIGNPSTIGGILVPIKSRSTAITSIYWELSNTTGTLLDSGTITVNIASNTSQDVLFVMNSVISNSVQLTFGYKCNQLCTAFGISVAPFVYTTPVAAYATSGTQTPLTWTNISSGNRNLWFQVGTVAQIASPTTDLMSEINRLVAPLTSFSVTAEIIHQADLYAVVGTEYNFYFENVIFGNMPFGTYDLNITCDIGKQYDRYFRVTPVSGNAGDHVFTLDVYYANVIIATKTFTLHVSATANGTGKSAQVFNFGDSTLSTGKNIIAATAKLGSAPAIAFKGTQGTAPNQHDGYGGAKFSTFINAGVNNYYFYYSGVTSLPPVGSVYSNNSSNFIVNEINSGVGYINCTRTSGTNSPNSSGTLTYVSGGAGGDPTITFTSVVTLNSNPLSNPSTGLLDVHNYVTTNGFTIVSGDWVMYQLIINDQFGQLDDAGATTAIAGAIANCNTLISAWKAEVTGIRQCIKISVAPTYNQYGFGIDYGTGQTLWRYQRNWNMACKAFIAAFDGATNQANEIWLMHYNSVVDRRYNMQLGTASVNAANSGVTISVASNGVHPADVGYTQMGWTDYAFLKNKVV